MIHRYTFQHLKEYVQFTILSLAVIVEGDIHYLYTQLDRLKNANINLRGKVNNSRNLLDQDLASIKNELQKLKDNSCSCECNNSIKKLRLIRFLKKAQLDPQLGMVFMNNIVLPFEIYL